MVDLSVLNHMETFILVCLWKHVSSVFGVWCLVTRVSAVEAAAAFCRQRPFWRQSFTNLHHATMDGPRFLFLSDLARPVSI